MKNYINLVTVLAAFMVLIGCENPDATNDGDEIELSDVALDDQTKKISYLMGLDNGSSILAMQVEFSKEAFQLGLEDALNGGSPRLSQEEIASTVSAFEADMKKKQEELQASQQALMAEQAGENTAKGADFMNTNSTVDGVVTTESGLQYRVITEGTGPTPTLDSTVEVHYVGRLIDGTEFDSSRQRGVPAQFGVTQVIPGWTEALMLMPQGSNWELVIPPELAYGPGGTGPIPPNATLIFDVELLKASVGDSDNE